MNRSKKISLVAGVLFIITGAWVWSAEPGTRSQLSTGKQTIQERTVRPLDLRSDRIVAAQVGLFYCNNLKGVEEKIKHLAEAGVNTLIIRVFQNRGDRFYQFTTPQYPSGVYFQTRYAPVVDDILGPVVQIANRYGLRVFAWMTTRFANYGFESMDGLGAFLYEFERKQIIPAQGFNLFREEILARLEGLYADLARYPIDGILFQDDLILKHNEGFSAEARRLFFEDHGYLPEPSILYQEISRDGRGKIRVSYTDHFWTWARWKNRKILALAERLMNAARRVRPDLRFAINLYYETVLDPEKSLAWYSQSLELARDFSFDYFSIMAYHRQMQEEMSLSTMEETLNQFTRLAEKALEMAGDPTRVLIKVQVVDWEDSTPLPLEETERFLRVVGTKPEIHVAMVPYQPDLPMEKMIRSLTLSRAQAEQGRAPVKPIAMREPHPSFSPE
jgi:biofilm PGA synthesis lipoprotein PgaB